MVILGGPFLCADPNRMVSDLMAVSISIDAIVVQFF